MIQEMKPYLAYKDSGVEWLGSVPEHWGVRRLKRLAMINPKKSEASLEPDCEVTFLPMERVGTDGRLVLKGRQRASKVWNGFTYFRRSDVLVAKITPCFENGKGACLDSLPTEIGFGSTEFHVLRASPLVLPQFLYRVTTLAEFRRLGAEAMTGAAGQQRVPESFVADFRIVLPPYSEQAAIVRFLDHVDRRIRRYIRSKQKLIALLNEQKLAIIQRAVTRGLDPNVRLKSSGVEWLGDVPEHWEVKRLRNLTTRVTSGSRGWSDYASAFGPLFIRIGNLTRNSLDLDVTEEVRLNLPESVLGEAARTQVAPNDVLLSITAFIGSVAVVPADLGEAYVSQHVACCRLSPEVANARWVGYVLLSPIGKTHGILSMNGGTKQGLSLDDVKNHIVLVPPRAEQDELVRKIDSQVSETETAILAIRHEIRVLREYRTRLIADVVTGKVDVREVAAQLPEEDEETEPLDETDAFDEVAEEESLELEAGAEEVAM